MADGSASQQIHAEMPGRGSTNADDELVKPGLSVGPLRLGDTRKQALQLFPPDPTGHHTYLDSGTEYFWLDSKNPKGGTVEIHFRDGVVFQIDSLTSRYHTSEGIAPYLSSPQEVRRKYSGLRAYVLSNYTTMALGEKPLIYWIDKEKGIAFAFAYYPEEHSRYLYEIIVFKPKDDIRDAGGSINSPEKRELPPYSLELANAIAQALRPPKAPVPGL